MADPGAGYSGVNYGNRSSPKKRADLWAWLANGPEKTVVSGVAANSEPTSSLDRAVGPETSTGPAA